MSISWNEIRNNALQFQKEWKDAEKESAEAQSFYNEFFEVFGVKRRRVAIYEQSAKTFKDTTASIDLFFCKALFLISFQEIDIAFIDDS